MTNLVPLAFSTTPHLLDIVHGRSDESKGHSAKCASLRDLHLEIRWLATIKPSQVFPLQIWINYNYHGPVEYDVAAPNTSIALIWGRLAPFKVHLCTHIIRKQVSGVRWRFLESHWIRLLRTRVIEGTVACWQSSSITLFSWCHFSNLLENNFNHLSCIPLKKTNKNITFGYHQELQVVTILSFKGHEIK